MIYTVSSIANEVRTKLNESSTVHVSSDEILRATNDAQLHMATRSLCIEKEMLYSTIPNCNRIKVGGIKVTYIELVGYDTVGVFDAVYVDDDVTWYNSVVRPATSLGGILKVLPTNIGHNPPLDTTQPQKWFNFGKLVIIDPVPTRRYVLRIYYADYPQELVNDTDVLDIPKEFHPCIPDLVVALMAIKLKRWGEVSYYYNRYISAIPRAKTMYVEKIPDPKAALTAPTR